jgi:hypothetical protein
MDITPTFPMLGKLLTGMVKCLGGATEGPVCDHSFLIWLAKPGPLASHAGGAATGKLGVLIRCIRISGGVTISATSPSSRSTRSLLPTSAFTAGGWLVE